MEIFLSESCMNLMKGWLMSTLGVLMMQEMQNTPSPGLFCLISQPWWRLSMRVPVGRNMKGGEEEADLTVCLLPGMGDLPWGGEIMEDQGLQTDTEMIIGMTGEEEVDLLIEGEGEMTDSVVLPTEEDIEVEMTDLEVHPEAIQEVLPWVTKTRDMAELCP